MDLTHLGHFTLPKPTTFPDTRRYGYPGGPIALHPDRDKLYVASHGTWDQAGLIQIPAIGGRAEHVIEPRPPESDAVHNLRLEYGLDTLSGFCVHDDRLHLTFYRFYSVQPPNQIDHPTFCSCSLALDGPSESLQRIGAFHQKAVAGYMCAHDGWIYCGRGDGAGKAATPLGPSLHRFRPEDTSIAEKIYYASYEEMALAPDWSPVDKWYGLAFIDEVPVFTGWKGRGKSWYGSSPEITWEDGTVSVDPYSSGKGYHSEDYYPILQIGTEQNPRTSIELSADFRPFAKAMGCAFDDSSRFLYVLEHGREVGSEEEPRVHVYRVPDPTPATPPPPPPIHEETIIVTTDTADMIFRGAPPAPQIDAATFLLGRAKEALS